MIRIPTCDTVYIAISSGVSDFLCGLLSVKCGLKWVLQRVGTHRRCVANDFFIFNIQYSYYTSVVPKMFLCYARIIKYRKTSEITNTRDPNQPR